MIEEMFLDEVGYLHLIINIVGHAELCNIVNLLSFEFHILESILEVVKIHAYYK